MNYTTSNGVKPRYDNGGTEFGLMHRELGAGYWMFDVDRVFASVEFEISMRKENEAFVEYRRNGKRIDFIALMEVKHRRSEFAEQALSMTDYNSYARLAMAQRLGCRLFVVFATDGKQPFTFYEIDTVTGESTEVGTLTYGPADMRERVAAFWRNVLRIEK